MSGVDVMKKLSEEDIIELNKYMEGINNRPNRTDDDNAMVIALHAILDANNLLILYRNAKPLSDYIPDDVKNGGDKFESIVEAIKKIDSIKDKSSIDIVGDLHTLNVFSFEPVIIEQIEASLLVRLNPFFFRFL